MSPFDLIIIGGGAAGHFAAIAAAENSRPGTRILILEKSSRVLGKVRVSGGGRCNVTQACDSPRPLIDHYPRGQKSLLGPFSHFGTADTVAWFKKRGVFLKTEADGRMFPVTDSSETVIACLVGAAKAAGVVTHLSTGVDDIEKSADIFHLRTSSGPLTTRRLLLASGGTRAASSSRLPELLGHQLNPAVPSLFALEINSPGLRVLSGITIENAALTLPGTKHRSEGPLLITHKGLSGPAVLKLSAWAAPHFHEKNYRLTLEVNWLPGENPATLLDQARRTMPKRKAFSASPHPAIPRRLWEFLASNARLDPKTTWAHLPKEETRALATLISNQRLEVTGQSTNKDEFVTCGGIPLKEINLKTMESKLVPGLFFAGEIMDIDGLTGGYNFQSAWTTAHLAGLHLAADL